MDETACNYAIGPSYLYVPQDSVRAGHAVGTDIKLHTTAVLAADATGEFLSPFIVIKRSAKKDDERSMRVLKILHEKPGFRREDGWKLEEWTRQINQRIKKNQYEYRTKHCLYLRHESGKIITSQHKAYLDEVKFAMYVDLILKPFKEAQGKLLLWMDGCSSHCTLSSKQILEESGIETAIYPPNMTAFLQVMDLDVCGPVKSYTRKRKAVQVYENFQRYLSHLATLGPIDDESQIPQFKGSIPDLATSILDFYNLMENEFTRPEFKSNIAKTFITSGMVPIEGNQFASIDNVLEGLSKGTIPSMPVYDTSNQEICNEIPTNLTNLFSEKSSDSSDNGKYDSGTDIDEEDELEIANIEDSEEE